MPDQKSAQPLQVNVDVDKVVNNLLNQLSVKSLEAAQWKALAEETMEEAAKLRELIAGLERPPSRPVHNERVTKSGGERVGEEAGSR